LVRDIEASRRSYGRHIRFTCNGYRSANTVADELAS
jgi:hypothetical protein